jgi:cellobiose phosphorylase
VCFTIGAADSRAEAALLTRKYSSIAEVNAALAKVKSKWDSLLSTLTIETPDTAMNVLINRWLKYQAIAGRLLGRTGYYQAGGAYGFRDQLQDSQIFLTIRPEQTKEQILLHARHQFKDGTVYHWWHPLSEVGLQTHMTDDLLWLPFITNSYIEETRDFSILDCKEPFIDDALDATLYDHCIRAIEKVFSRLSKRGIPLIGAGDWNDGLSAVGLMLQGESIWLGEFFYYVLTTFAAISQSKDIKRAQDYLKRAKLIRESINNYGWDGEWYYYGTKDSGEKFGSKENKEGTIHLNPQTWAVISGVADQSRAHQVMDVVKNRLDYKAGTVLLYPAYRTPDEKIGYLTRYAPGTRENGATYTHAATWSIIAAAKLGRAEDAYRYFSEINPILRGKKPDEYCAEPYVTPGNIDGPDSPFYGRGGWTWYSGSATWLYKAGLEWILGVRASLEGLIVAPCIPAQWKSYNVSRIFRGATYSIQVNNPDNVSTGIRNVTIDGSSIKSFSPNRLVVLPIFKPDSHHSIIIEMGYSK